jgi:RES domain-containing protein
MHDLKVWRLSRRVYADRAFSGEGTRLFAGRWNPIGVPVVYASLSLSLAVLEVFVHMTARADPDDYVSVAVSLGIEGSKAERINEDQLPNDWRLVDHPTLKAMGAEWVKSMRSLVLLVPSVVIEGEWNAVINPLHPDAARIGVDKPKPLRFDERMFTSRR